MVEFVCVFYQEPHQLALEGRQVWATWAVYRRPILQKAPGGFLLDLEFPGKLSEASRHRTC